METSKLLIHCANALSSLAQAASSHGDPERAAIAARLAKTARSHAEALPDVVAVLARLSFACQGTDVERRHLDIMLEARSVLAKAVKAELV